MNFNYKATSTEGKMTTGTIDAPTIDLAINALQRRGLIVVYVQPTEGRSLWARINASFGTISMGAVVILSRQLATLFEAKVAVLDAFKLLAAEADSPAIRLALTEIIDDVEGGVPISAAMSKHPNVFSSFYVNMIRSGEESGKLSEAFSYLADHLERSSDLVSRVRNALIYPAFVIVSFIVIMILMFVIVIPQLTSILTETGQELPFMTKLIIGISTALLHYGIYMLVAMVLVVMAIWQYARTSSGKLAFARMRISLPYFGGLYRKLYLARIADNMDTMLTSGISMVRSLEVTADVVGSEVYKRIVLDAVESVKAGNSLSEALARHEEVPPIFVQMTHIGEETGKLGYVLKTVARFYKRGVDTAIDTIVGLIEPFMIIILALGVGILLVAVLSPIYNITASI